MDNNIKLRNFYELPYDELTEMNLQAREDARTKSRKELKKKYLKFLSDEPRIKAVTLCFSNIEGKLHLLDYDKQFFIDSHDNLTFDGSSIRGFTDIEQSDLRLYPDWKSIRWLPSDIFGPGKIIFFADVMTTDKQPYMSDFRSAFKQYTHEIKKKHGHVLYASTETEGFLVEGRDAEQMYSEIDGFKLISSGGYFHALPQDPLKLFIDRSAEAQRAMGFRNEKDHPEVAPSQFELNFSYDEAVRTADNIQLYKLVCRQIADSMGMTSTFLPKPISGINGSGMHMNISLQKKGKNLFYDPKGEENLSTLAWNTIDKILNHASELCLIFNSSVNAYRRLDPNFEAPNQIKVSPVDRSSMIRIPAGNEKSARIEVRSVGPDANPYLALYSVLKTIHEGQPQKKSMDKRERVRFLPGTIQDAIRYFRRSDLTETILGAETKNKYIDFKSAAAHRSPRDLGTEVKRSEVIYHHEVTNQVLWKQF